MNPLITAFTGAIPVSLNKMDYTAHLNVIKVQIDTMANGLWDEVSRQEFFFFSMAFGQI